MAFVLIVDANERQANRVSDALIGAGHACGWVTTAEQACALLRWRVPDTVLLDQAIPGADGGSLPRRLRSVSGVADLPIILLATEALTACLGHGADAVLDEIRLPLDPGFLVWRVNHAIEAHRGRPLDDGDERLMFRKAEAGPSFRSLA